MEETTNIEMTADDETQRQQETTFKHKKRQRKSPLLTFTQSVISLRVFLPLLTLIQIALPVILIIILSYVFSQRSITALSVKLQERTSDIATQFTIQLLDPYSVLQTVANEVRYGAISATLNETRDRRLLFGHAVDNQETKNAVYVTRSNGNFMAYTKSSASSYEILYINPSTYKWLEWYAVDANGDPSGSKLQATETNMRKSLWYEGSVERKGLYVTKVYEISSIQEATLGITASIPVYASRDDTNSEFLGVVSMDYSLSSMNEFLRNHNASKNSRSFIVEKDGTFVATSSGDMLRKVTDIVQYIRLKCHESSDKLIAAGCRAVTNAYGSYDKTYIAAGTDGSLLHHKFSQGKQKNFMVLQQFTYNDPDVNWLFVTIVPENDYLEKVKQNTWAMVGILILIAFCAILIAVFATWLLITRPLNNMTRQIDKVSNMNFDSVSKSTTIFYELSRIQRSFLSLVVALENFRKYVPRSVTMRATSDDLNDAFIDDTELVPHYVTILHLNITDFGRLSEQLLPHDLSVVIKDTYSALSKVLNEQGASIDTFVGDYVLALFNVPNSLENHEVRACEAALKCINCISALKTAHSHLSELGLPNLNCRVGIHADVALVGAIGSSNMNYTAVGGAVSLTTTLESLNKYYQTTILISEDLHQKVKSEFVCRVVDVVQFNGDKNKHGVTLYELLEKRVTASNNSLAIEKYCEQWKRQFQSGNVQEALNTVSEALQIPGYENNYNLQVLQRRCAYYLQNTQSFQAVFQIKLN